ncbi:MAG: AAA family ATPase [Burkholderiales bacterium]|nr:AAA family ATPase [Burkholderiales bacterium]
MTRIIAIANQKGGVGKTTTAVNLAAGLARSGRRVLLADLDPQGNATMGSGIDKRALRFTVYHVLLGLSAVQNVRMRADGGTYDVLPANRDLAGAEVEMVDLENRETRLKSALAPVAAEYDLILLDCPPALNLLTVNGLVAAESVIIPMQCEYYALEGLTDLINTIKKVRAHLNPRIQIDGLLRTMFDPRNTLAQQVSADLQQHFGDKVYETIIPRNIRLAEAPSYGKPSIEFDPACKGSQAYLALAEELLCREAATHAAA